MPPRHITSPGANFFFREPHGRGEERSISRLTRGVCGGRDVKISGPLSAIGVSGVTPAREMDRADKTSRVLQERGCLFMHWRLEGECAFVGAM